MQDDIIESTPPSRGGRTALAALGGGLAVVLIGGGALAIAGAATADTPAPTPSASAPAGTPQGAPPGPGRHGPGGFGFGLGDRLGAVLHGTAVVKKQDGTFATVAVQHGKVTAVSATSISVKSDDGYEATYVVNSDTKVNRDGKISDIKTDADVVVTGTVSGSTTTATRVVDVAALKALKDKFEQGLGKLHHGWGPGPDGSAKPTPSASGSSA